MPVRMPKRRSTGRLILGIPIGFVVATGVALALVLMWLREDAIRSGMRVAAAFAQLTEDQTTRTIQTVDQTLQLVRIRLAGLEGVVASSQADSLRDALRTYLTDRPSLRSIVVLDSGGRIVAATEEGAIGRDLSDRSYFKQYLENPEDRFRLNSPVVSRQDQTPVIPATRPWIRNGEFAGVVIASVDPPYLSRIWTADDETGGSVALLNREGTLLVRSPHDESLIGRSFAGGPQFETLAEGRAGAIRVGGVIDGVERVVTYRRLTAYPDLIVTVSQGLDKMLAAWRWYALVAALAWLTASSALTALAYRLRREWRRRSMAEHELEMSRDRLAAVMDHTVDGLVVIDQRGMVLSFSRPAEAIFGYAANEVIGRKVNMLMPEPYHSAHDSYLESYLRTGHAKIIDIGREVQGRRKDGAVFPMDLAVGEIPRASGARQFVGTIRDITRRKTTEDQLRQAQKMEAVGQLTGGIAHDFNNMLAVMLGNVEMALETPLDPRTALLLKTAERAALRGAELTSRLLAFSRQQTLLPERIDVNRLVIEMVELLRRTLGETIRVETKLDPQPMHALVDAGQLENALLNLAVNARDAMPAGGVLSIATSSVVLDEDYAGKHQDVAPGAYRVIAVSDSGIGMTAAVKERAFEPFFTTKEVGKGSGLGLSMVYGFVKQSNGHVTIYSEPGRGATVRLYLPVSPEDRQQEELAPAPIAEAFADGQIVLVVEDDDDVRSVIATMVARLGFSPIVAADGPEALKTLEGSAHLDLLITDVVMPKGMSGLDLAAAAHASRPHLPVLFVSGYSDETEALAEVVRSGAALLSKPFSRAQLAGAIKTAMRGRQSEGT